MKQFKKLPVFLAQVSVATGILCTSAFATDRGAVPDANTVSKVWDQILAWTQLLSQSWVSLVLSTMQS